MFVVVYRFGNIDTSHMYYTGKYYKDVPYLSFDRKNAVEVGYLEACKVSSDIVTNSPECIEIVKVPNRKESQNDM